MWHRAIAALRRAFALAGVEFIDKTTVVGRAERYVPLFWPGQA
jgi:hypothetical protein